VVGFIDLREAALEKQNITLTLPKDALKRVKVTAAERGTSVSALMERLPQDDLARHEGYEQAHQRQSALLTMGFDLGTKGERDASAETVGQAGDYDSSYHFLATVEAIGNLGTLGRNDTSATLMSDLFRGGIPETFAFFEGFDCQNC
jgi:hypothetical protein